MKDEKQKPFQKYYPHLCVAYCKAKSRDFNAITSYSTKKITKFIKGN